MSLGPLLRTASAVALVVLVGGPSASVNAASGGPDAFGYTWRNQEDGCPVEVEGLGPAAQRFADPTATLGPFALPFTFPFHGRAVDRAWIAPNGFVTFTDPGAAVSAPQAP